MLETRTTTAALTERASTAVIIGSAGGQTATEINADGQAGKPRQSDPVRADETVFPESVACLLRLEVILKIVWATYGGTIVSWPGARRVQWERYARYGSVRWCSRRVTVNTVSDIFWVTLPRVKCAWWKRGTPHSLTRASDGCGSRQKTASSQVSWLGPKFA